MQLLTNNRVGAPEKTLEKMQLRKGSRDALQEEVEKEKDVTAHEAISVADWKAQKFGKGRKTPR